MEVSNYFEINGKQNVTFRMNTKESKCPKIPNESVVQKWTNDVNDDES
jgi:hypothetical protein